MPKLGKKIKTGLVLGGTAATAGVAFFLTGRRINQGGYPVTRGTITWTPKFEEGNQAKIETPQGREMPIGSTDAFFAAYDLAVKYTESLTAYTQLAERAMSPEQLRSLYRGCVTNARYPVGAVCSEQQKHIIADMVNAAVNLGQSLRVLADLAETANIREAFQPTKHKGRADLRYIRFGSALNPMAIHVNENEWAHSCLSTQLTSGWRGIGLAIIQTWLRAYYDVTNMPSLREAVANMESDALRVEESTVARIPCDTHTTSLTTMGFPVIPIVLIIIGVAIALQVRTATRGAFHFLGVNLDFLEMKREHYERALACTYDENRSEAERARCREELTEVSEEVQSYKPSMSGTLRVAIIGGIAIGGVWAYSLIRRG